MSNKKIEKIDFIVGAMELINTQGYHFSSIDDIAKKCGLSKASVYHYVDSKQKLAELIINHFHQSMRDAIFTPVIKSQASAEEKLQLLANKFADFYTDRLGGCLMGNLIAELVDSQPQITLILKNFFDDCIGTIARVLGEKLNTEMARRIAEDITAQLQGAVLLGRLYKNNNTLMRVLSRLSSLLEVRENTLVAMS